jgi:hypothetical protein
MKDSYGKLSVAETPGMFVIRVPRRLNQRTQLASCRNALMKRNVSLVFGFLAIVSVGFVRAVDYPTQVQSTPNLVGYWRFETGVESSVNGYTGSVVDGAIVGGSSSGPVFLGIANNHAALFDGSGDGVLTNLAGQVTFASAGTIVAWVFLDAQPSTLGRIVYIAGRSQAGNDMDLQIDPDDIARFYTTSGGGVAALAPLPLSQWVMIAASFDTAANARKIYVDGNLVGSDQPGIHAANSAPFSIAYSTVWGNRWFSGAIDEVAIFDRALTDAEIRGFQEAAGDLIFRSGFEY